MLRQVEDTEGAGETVEAMRRPWSLAGPGIDGRTEEHRVMVPSMHSEEPCAAPERDERQGARREPLRRQGCCARRAGLRVRQAQAKPSPPTCPRTSVRTSVRISPPRKRASRGFRPSRTLSSVTRNSSVTHGPDEAKPRMTSVRPGSCSWNWARGIPPVAPFGGWPEARRCGGACRPPGG